MCKLKLIYIILVIIYVEGLFLILALYCQLHIVVQLQAISSELVQKTGKVEARLDIFQKLSTIITGTAIYGMAMTIKSSNWAHLWILVLMSIQHVYPLPHPGHHQLRTDALLVVGVWQVPVCNMLLVGWSFTASQNHMVMI